MATDPIFAPDLARRLWPAGDAVPAQAGWRGRLMNVPRILYAITRDLSEGRIPLHAASLVYTTLLSLVPLVALAFSVLKGFGVHYRFEPLLATMLAPLGPQAKEVSDRLMDFVSKVDVGVLGAVGLALLFYTAISMVQKVETAFNDIWHVSETRSMARKFTDYLSVLLIGPVLIFSAIATAGAVAASETMQHLSNYLPLAILLDVGGQLLPVLLVTCAFTFLYKFLTFTRVYVRSAIVGGLVAGLIWLIAGWAFATFVATTSSYTAIYSAFAALILFLLWLNVNWTVLLIGNSIAFYHQHPEYMLLGGGPAILSNRCRERLALAIMQAIGRAQYAGEQPPTVRDLRRGLGVPEETVQRILTVLGEEGLLATTADDPPRWMAVRPFEATEMKVVVEAVRRAGERRGLELKRISTDAVVDATENRIDDAVTGALDGLHLKDLVTDDGIPPAGNAGGADRPAGFRRGEAARGGGSAAAADPRRSGSERVARRR